MSDPGADALVKTARVVWATASSKLTSGGRLGVGIGAGATTDAGGALTCLGASTTASLDTQPTTPTCNASAASVAPSPLLTLVFEIGTVIVAQRVSHLCALENGSAAVALRCLRRRSRASERLHAVRCKPCKITMREFREVGTKVGRIVAGLDRLPVGEVDLLRIEQRACRRGSRARFVKVEVALYGGLGPRRLAAVRIGFDRRDHPFEHLLERYARRGHRFDQLTSEDTVRAECAVLSGLAWSRRI